ncbi:NAD(P)-dependent dehydrogenase (short-subunit alcohol dehydrogenase family) [Rhodanobacter sp. TND4EL1]
MDLELTERTVVITGGSKGIGLACAIAFAREGARVIGVSRDPSNLGAAQEQMAALGLAMAVQPADLKDSVAASLVMELIVKIHGPIDVLVNCAGAARRTPPDELDAAAVLAAMQAKYLSYMHAIDPVIRRMGERGSGSIVNVIGQGGRQANPQHIGGGSANAALMLATVGYANAYASKGVRVNAINPGITRTGRVDEAWMPRCVRAASHARQCWPASLPAFRWDAWPSRQRSPTSQCSWRRRGPAMSPARSSRWMVARRP